jgi:hypothetical protein
MLDSLARLQVPRGEDSVLCVPSVCLGPQRILGKYLLNEWRAKDMDGGMDRMEVGAKSRGGTW